MHKLISIKSWFVTLSLLLLLSPLQAASVSATAGGQIPLEIEPVCSDAASEQAHWKVTNKNAHEVNLHWTNFANNATGDYSAVTGTSELLTSYVAADPNNTTQFMSGSDTNQTNATKAPCQASVPQPDPVQCVDGHDQQNIVTEFLTKDTVRVTVKNAKLLCDNVEIYFSSYIMPANYDGRGFEGNPTAYPQTIYSSQSATLPKNSPVNQVLTIGLPDSCNNTQVDVYYAPEIRQVGADGHGTQNIVGRIYESDGQCQATGGQGGGDPTETTAGPEASPAVQTGSPQPAVTAVPAGQLPKELVNTGSNLLAMLLLIPALVAFTSYASMLQYHKRRYAYSATK